MQYRGRKVPQQKCGKGLTVNEYPSIEMSVKGFLDKYFKPQASVTPTPEKVLEPMVGTVPRNQLDYYKSSNASVAVAPENPNAFLKEFTAPYTDGVLDFIH